MVCTKQSRTVIVLAGGGLLPNAVWRGVARGAGRHTVLVVSWADVDPAIASRKARAVCKKLQWLGCRTTTDISNLKTASAVWFTGGDSNMLIRRVQQDADMKATLGRIARDGGFVGGTSAGAILLGTRGVGLVPLNVCVHAIPHSLEHCISEETALVISDGVMRTVGHGGVSIRIPRRLEAV